MRRATRCGGAEPSSWSGRLHLTAVVLTVATMMGLVPACSSSDNGGGTNTTPCLRFEGSADPPGAITVTAVDGEPNDDECNLLYVDLLVHDVDDLYGANIVVTYPSNVVTFSAASGTGSILSSGNTALEIDAAVTGSGQATIGISRLGVDMGVNVPNDGGDYLLVRLVFSRNASSGSGSLDFAAGTDLLNSGDPDPPPAVIQGSVWRGGTIGIVQL